MIGGVPNVGKSTLINSLRSKDKEVNQSKKSGAREQRRRGKERSREGSEKENMPIYKCFHGRHVYTIPAS